MVISEYQIAFRVLVAACLGAFIGFERERAHKAAGLRTHALTAMSASLLSGVSIFIYDVFGGELAGAVFDTRIISNIIVGIGFIGGGTIMRFTDRVVGTTTAASLFAVASIGIATGLGMYFTALVVSLITYILLALVGHFQRSDDKLANIEIVDHEK